MSASLFSLVGYDPSLIARLNPGHQRKLERLCRWILVPSICMGLSASLFIWLVERTPLVSLGLGLFVALVVHNMLRLLIAGGGAAPQLSETQVKAWAPTLPPLLILGGLAACFAQPLQLALYAKALDPGVEEYRQELVQRHYGGATANEEYRRRLETCYFATRRLALLWRVPEGPLAFTLLFCALCTSPLLLGHTRYLPSLRAYELVRWQRTRQQLLAAERFTQAQLSASLSQFGQLPPRPLPKFVVVAASSPAQQDTL